MTLTRRSMLAAALILPMMPGIATAAPGLPNGAKPASGQAVIAHYANKSIRWKEDTNPMAGIYFRGDGVALTIWKTVDSSKNEAPYSVGVGRWKVNTRGTQCYAMTWYYAKDGETQTFEAPERCRDHRVDGDGVLYGLETKPERQKEWWNVEWDGDGSEVSRTKNGNQFARLMKREARRLGVTLP